MINWLLRASMRVPLVCVLMNYIYDFIMVMQGVFVNALESPSPQKADGRATYTDKTLADRASDVASSTGFSLTFSGEKKRFMCDVLGLDKGAVMPASR